MGKIEAINITNISEENTFYVNQAILKKGKGIVNDRYYENFKENYKILGKYIKDMSSETPDIETFLFVRDHISKYQLNINITSKGPN